MYVLQHVGIKWQHSVLIFPQTSLAIKHFRFSTDLNVFFLNGWSSFLWFQTFKWRLMDGRVGMVAFRVCPFQERSVWKKTKLIKVQSFNFEPSANENKWFNNFSFYLYVTKRLILAKLFLTLSWKIQCFV